MKGIANIHIYKDERVQFDGEWVTDGFFMAKKEFIRLSDRKLQTFIDDGTIFSRIDGETKIGDSALVPEMQRLIDVAAKLEDEYKIHLEMLSVIILTNPKTSARIFSAKTYLTAIDNKYTELLDLGDVYQAKSDYTPAKECQASIYRNRQLIAVVMPVRLGEGGLPETITRLAKIVEEKE